MERALIHGPMELVTKENGRTIREMEWVHRHGLAGIVMTESGRRT